MNFASTGAILGYLGCPFQNSSNRACELTFGFAPSPPRGRVGFRCQTLKPGLERAKVLEMILRERF